MSAQKTEKLYSKNKQGVILFKGLNINPTVVLTNTGLKGQDKGSISLCSIEGEIMPGQSGLLTLTLDPFVAATQVSAKRPVSFSRGNRIYSNHVIFVSYIPAFEGHLVHANRSAHRAQLDPSFEVASSFVPKNQLIGYFLLGKFSKQKQEFPLFEYYHNPNFNMEVGDDTVNYKTFKKVISDESISEATLEYLEMCKAQNQVLGE